jgi:hypothetical protein
MISSASTRWPLHAWEPVIYHGGRQLVTGRLQADSLVTALFAGT